MSAPVQAVFVQAGPGFGFEHVWGRSWGNTHQFFRASSLRCSFQGTQLLDTLAQLGILLGTRTPLSEEV